MPSQAFISACNARVSEDPLYAFFHVSHSVFDTTEFPDGIRVYSGGKTVDDVLTVDGIDYIPWAFRWRRPDQRSDRLIQVPIEIDNVDPRIMKEVLKLTEPADVQIWTALKGSPGVIEEGPLVFDLQRVTGDKRSIRGQLGLEPMLWMRFGRYTFDPARFPGVHR